MRGVDSAGKTRFETWRSGSRLIYGLYKQHKEVAMNNKILTLALFGLLVGGIGTADPHGDTALKRSLRSLRTGRKAVFLRPEGVSGGHL